MYENLQTGIFGLKKNFCVRHIDPPPPNLRPWSSVGKRWTALQVGCEVLAQVSQVLFTSDERMEREIDRRISAPSVVFADFVRVCCDENGGEQQGEALCLVVGLRSYPHEVWVNKEQIVEKNTF